MFDLIQHLTKFKTKWSKLSQLQQKEFSVFVANKFIATNFTQIAFVNDLQQYTQLSDEQVYNIYLRQLHKFVPLNFIKKTKKELPKDLIKFVSNIKHTCSKKELEQFILAMSDTDFIQFCNNYQIESTTIKKWQKAIM